MTTSMVLLPSMLGAVALLGEPPQWTLTVGLCLITASIVFSVQSDAPPAGKPGTPPANQAAPRRTNSSGRTRDGNVMLALLQR